MAEGPELTDEGWTLESFTGAIHRGGVGLWAWSPTRRLAQLDSLCREFWGPAAPAPQVQDAAARRQLFFKPRIESGDVRVQRRFNKRLCVLIIIVCSAHCCLFTPASDSY